MIVRFYYGPDHIPFYITGNIVSGEVIPFHGIISRGLLNQLKKLKDGMRLWIRYAPGLFNAATGGEPDEQFEMLQEMAETCNVLSYYQSCYAAERYVLNYCLLNEIVDKDIDLWNIKEGHTSSVWKVTIKDENDAEHFILNVARDEEAGKELKLSSKKLKMIGESYPESDVAKVFDISMLRDEVLPMEVIVTRNEWIENAFEIHKRNSRINHKEELLMVERFLTDANNPALINSVRGRIFNSEETEKIRGSINDFLISASSCLSEKTEININDGDVVWNGDKAIVVALS